MPLKTKSRWPSSTARRVKRVLRKAPSLKVGRAPSLEREVGRLPRKRRSESGRLAAKIELEARVVWNRLLKAGGIMPFDDRTPAAQIQAEFGLSKKAFKRGLGRLYRLHRVELLPKGVRAITPPTEKKKKEETKWRKPVSQS